MKTFNHIYTFSAGQRKALAVFMLVLALTNSQVPAARAADPMAQLDPIAFVQTPLVDDAVLASIQPNTENEIETVQADQPTVQEVLLDVCKSKGYGQDCAKTLLGMLWNESSNRSTVIGDNGKARGYFQIHVKLHNISTDCAEDLACSANWSLKYLESHGYPNYLSYAVQCHNSCNVNNGYAAKALRNGKIFWDKPLAVKQAAPVQLAIN
jgi:hypothetical protein